MNIPVISTFLMLFAWYSEVKPAQPLLTFNSETEIFELNKDLLLEIAELQQPIRVIAVIGDARIGKSTTLNLINHIWSGANQTYIEEVFKTATHFYLSRVTCGLRLFSPVTNKEKT